MTARRGKYRKGERMESEIPPNLFARRKGGIDDSLFMIVDFIVLILVLFLIYNMTASSKPYDQIAVANLDKLAGAIQKLCVEDTPQTIKFELEQPKPLASLGTVGKAFNAFFDIGKRAMLSINGDPLYTIYYEAFPPGDAWAWEEHLDMSQRAVIYYKPEKDEAVIKNARGKLEKFVKDELVKNYKTVIPYVFGNVVLENYNKKISGWDSSMIGVGGAGIWDTEEKSQKAFYIFGQLSRFNEMEKSMIKYRACGENTLCMKTTSGIVRVPLTGCEDLNEDGKLKVFVFKYHSFDAPSESFWSKVRETWDKLIQGMDSKALVGVNPQSQYRPLALASPCTIQELEIKIEACTVMNGHAYTYPIYEIRNVIKDSNGNEDFELHRVGYYIDYREFDVLEKRNAPNGYTTFTGKCIVVQIKDKTNDAGFCQSIPGTFMYELDTGNKPKVKDMGNYVLLPETSGAPHSLWGDTWGLVFGSWDAFWPR